MAVPAIKSVTFGIEVSDLDASTKWYERLFGSAPQSPDEGVIEFQLSAETYLMLSATSGQAGMDGAVSLQVDDLEEAKRAVEELGVESSQIERISDVLVYFDVKDPDGHTVTLLQIMEGE